jgi:hypothetical protein
MGGSQKAVAKPIHFVVVNEFHGTDEVSKEPNRSHPFIQVGLAQIDTKSVVVHKNPNVFPNMKSPR